MSKTFIKKEGLALVSLARYLFGLAPGARLKTIDELSSELNLSVGVVQHALKTLETASCVTLERRGRNGTLLSNMNYPALLEQADIGNIVCAMPLPYTLLYEGLASALKAQFEGYPLYYAHMRGADVRIECLIDGVYDMAVVSHLAAESYLRDGKVTAAMMLGAGSYVDGHQLVYRKGEKQNIRRIGLDSRSPDQRLLTEVVFAGQDIERINLPYNESLTRIERGEIDATVWNVTEDLDSLNLVKEPLNHYPVSIKASEAVLLVRNDDRVIPHLVKTLVNLQRLLAHQQEVKKGTREPSY
uniref:Putative transcriptional regulator, GntR family n=1 Tax=Serratia proteamaculans (strain 568) TaxID=399741 RepID=A8GJ08_SERP5